MDVVAVIGLGYVGLPLAVAFGKLLPTIGYDLMVSNDHSPAKQRL
jgi:UDP-N-acetyl-D-galactosamine dehydrogenase